MNIAACWIVEGDEKLESLQKSVDSIKKYVNSINITANGSQTKKTESWCKKNGYNYSFLKWNDNFSEQRNFNFNQAGKADFIFWMDSDDVLIGGEKLQELAELSMSNDIDCLYLDYWYSSLFDGEPSAETLKSVEIRHMRERLIKPGKMIWKKRLHETPVEIEGVPFKHSQYKKDDCVVLHLGSHRYETKEVTDKRMDRNRRLLELDLEEETKNGKPDPRTIVYLMKIYAEQEDEITLKKCILLGEDYMKLSGWNQERGVCRSIQAKCFQKMKMYKDAINLYHESIKEYPFSVNTYIRLAHCLTLVGKFAEADHFIKLALNNEDKHSQSGIDNILENELLSTETLIRLHWEWKQNRSVRKAYQFAKKLVELNPAPQNVEYAEQLRALANLDVACEHTHKLCEYLESINDEKAVLDVLKSVPTEITQQPFAINLWKKNSNPKFWQRNEIVYYCGAGLENWDGDSLKVGIGGSETAVIELAKEWTKMGWKVTVYGNPTEIKVIDGVTYIPHYYLNTRDKFNIFIEWRNTHFADKISCKKYFVDFHDVITPETVKDKLQYIDGIMVKSQAHKNLLLGVGYDKVKVISNGIS